MEERFVGIDIGKKTMEVRFLNSLGDVTKKWNGYTDHIGRKKLASLLTPKDTIGIEAGALSFVLAREIRDKSGAKVHVLNPGRLFMIFRSVKKTDSEDALKIARFVLTQPEDTLPTVKIPSEKEEEYRALANELQFLAQSRTKYVNRLHSIFIRAGITDVSKKHLKRKEQRAKVLEKLDSYRKKEAERLHTLIVFFEDEISKLESKECEVLSQEKNSGIVLSVPGIGPKTALAFIAHIGNGERFYHSKEVSNYVGMVPRIDISGQQIRYGGIHKRGCSVLRALFVQAAWSLIRASNGGALQQKYRELSVRIGKKKAIVAIARRMLELCWTLIQKQEMYRFTSEEALKKKLKFYGIKHEGIAA